MVAQGGFDQSDMDTEDKQKPLFEGVDMRTPITEPEIAELLRNFAVAVGKNRLAEEATAIAASLVDVGVDTYGDLRMMTCQVYVDYCGVKPMDAVRLVAHFAQPEKAEKVASAPRGVAKSVRTRTKFVVVNRETGPGDCHDDDVGHHDGHTEDVQDTSEVSGAVGGEVMSDSQLLRTDASQMNQHGLDAGNARCEAANLPAQRASVWTARCFVQVVGVNLAVVHGPRIHQVA